MRRIGNSLCGDDEPVYHRPFTVEYRKSAWDLTIYSTTVEAFDESLARLIVFSDLPRGAFLVTKP